MVVFLSSKLLTVCIYCFDLFPLLSKSFKMSLKENVGGYWLLCWHCSLLCSPPPHVPFSSQLVSLSSTWLLHSLSQSLLLFHFSLSFPSASLWPVPFCDPHIFPLDLPPFVSPISLFFLRRLTCTWEVNQMLLCTWQVLDRVYLPLESWKSA